MDELGELVVSEDGVACEEGWEGWCNGGVDGGI